MENICVGIVTYNPDISRLKQNFDSISNQAEVIYVADNASNNIKDIQELIYNYENIILLRNEANKGIAYALNKIIITSKRNGFKWVLTLDQDSICEKDIINEYKKRVLNKNIGMLCCKIQDINLGELNKFEKNDGQDEFVEFCITSGSAISVKAWECVGGFDNELFIDRVDTDICYALLKNNYKIIQIPYKGLVHEIGTGKAINVLGKEIYLYNHSPIRRYYISRNSIIMSKRYGKTTIVHELKYLLSRMILILFYEDQKWHKFYNSLCGIIDGLRRKSNRNSYCNNIEYL